MERLVDIAELADLQGTTAEDGLCKYSSRCHRDCEADKRCRLKEIYDEFPEYDIDQLGIGARI